MFPDSTGSGVLNACQVGQSIQAHRSYIQEPGDQLARCKINHGDTRARLRAFYIEENGAGCNTGHEEERKELSRGNGFGGATVLGVDQVE